MELNDFQKDAIREVMMIGAGHASTAMARALKKEIDIKIPLVELCPIEDVPKKVGNLESLIIGVYTKIKGELKGSLLTMFSKKDSLRLASMTSGKTVDKISEVPSETVSGLADILAVSTFGAISEFFEIKIHQTPSELSYDILGALLQQVLVDIAQVSDQVLFSRTDIYVSTEKFNCLQILFLESASLDFLLRRLEVKL